MVWMVRAGAIWINLVQVRTVERRENGAAIVTMVGGKELALLPDEAVEMDQALRMVCQHVNPLEMELLDGF